MLNLGYFGVEFAVALRVDSVSLFADSVDFLEDASVNLLISSQSHGRREPAPASAWRWRGFWFCLRWHSFGRHGPSS